MFTCYSEYCNAEWGYAECHCGLDHHAEYHKKSSMLPCYAEYYYAEYCYVECGYAECHN